MALTQTKQQAIYRHVKERILSGVLPPGQRLIIDDIAREMGLSIIPVREALQLLQAERLVEMRPHAGASVAPITDQNIDEVFTILEGMEAMAVRHVATRKTAGNLKRLKALLAQMDAAQKQHDFEKWSTLNMKFHLTISEATGMPLLQEITSRALEQWDRIRRHFFNGATEHRLVDAQREHHAIVKALERGKPNEAEKLIRHHNQRARKHYSRMTKRG